MTRRENTARRENRTRGKMRRELEYDEKERMR